MESQDPHLWLEDIEGDEAIAWVKSRNDLTMAKLSNASQFAHLNETFKKILTSNDRIPRVRKAGQFAYNFWQDERNPRGIWRRTLWTAYLNKNPKWETVIDFDDLSHQEGVKWSFKFADFLKPDCSRCLLYLSPGGSDAGEIREFDLVSKQFLYKGFSAQQCKGAMDWIDQDKILVFIDFGPDSLTTSGYPRIVKEWQRGTPIESASIIFAGEKNDLSVSAMVARTDDGVRQVILRAKSFYASEYFLRLPGGNLRRIPVPESSDIYLFQRNIIITLKEPWAINDQIFTAGCVLVCDLEALIDNRQEFAVLFEPDEKSAVQGIGCTKDFVFIHTTRDLKNSLQCFRPTDSGWSNHQNPNVLEFGNIQVWSVDKESSNEIFAIVNNYLTPDTLKIGDIHSDLTDVHSLPHQFDSSNLRTEQFFTKSIDGLEIPYFVVSRADLEPSGDHPTILYGYGGFEVSLLPEYDALVGAGWLADGGVYVVANIRGGGEYGPRWHRAALKENRHKCYEDFAAVARDLIRRKVTSPARLGIWGRSNGGLLVGNMLTRYPELFGAVACGVPLLDMKRYNKLLAGASWMEEYGDPDQPECWEYIKTFSPYHTVRTGVEYPSTFFITSTKDDRVHPGHARKMMARMEDLHQKVWYYESFEGGHAGSSTPEQKALMSALTFQFFRQELGLKS